MDRASGCHRDFDLGGFGGGVDHDGPVYTYGQFQRPDNAREINFYTGRVSDLTASQKKSLIPAFGAIAGLATLFVSKNNTLQRLTTIFTMASLAKMHFDVSKESKKNDLLHFSERVLEEVQYDSEEEDNPTLLQGMWLHARMTLREGMQNPRELREKVVQMGAYIVGAAVLLRSNIAMKVLFFIASSLHIRNIFTQYSSLKNEMQRKMPANDFQMTEPLDAELLSDGQALDQAIREIDFSSNSVAFSNEAIFEEGTAMYKAWIELISAPEDINNRIKSFERAHQICPMSLVVLSELGKLYLQRNDFGDSGHAREVLTNMERISENDPLTVALGETFSQRSQNFQVDFSLHYETAYERGNRYLAEGQYFSAAMSFEQEYQTYKTPVLQVRLGYVMLLNWLNNADLQKSDGNYYNTALEHIKEACKTFDVAQPIFCCALSELRNQEALLILRSKDAINAETLYETLNAAKQALLETPNPNQNTNDYFMVLLQLQRVSLSWIHSGDKLNDKRYYDLAFELLNKYVGMNSDHQDPHAFGQMAYVCTYKTDPDYQRAKAQYEKALQFGHTAAQFIYGQLARIDQLERQQEFR